MHRFVRSLTTEFRFFAEDSVRACKQRRRQREQQKAVMFNMDNSNFAHFLVHFFAVIA